MPVVLDYHRPARPVRESGDWVIHLATVFGGALMPIICFTMACLRCPLAPTWQEGGWDCYVRLLLDGRAAWPMFPLLAYSIVCLFLALNRKSRFSSAPAVRWGIYGGAVLSLQYTIIMIIALVARTQTPYLVLGVGGYLTAGAMSAGAVFVLWWLVRRFGTARMILAMCICLGICLLLGMVVAAVEIGIAGEFFFVLILACLGGAPVWALGAYSYLSIRLLRDRPSQSRGRNWMLIPFGWLTAYALAWRTSILTAIAVYAELPPVSDHCYICTAAAEGHPRIVRSRSVRRRDGVIVRVNPQLRTLKLAEIALAAVMPRAHWLCRRIYDRFGPRLAAQIRHPLAADLAYLSLKPLEWTANALLRLLLPNASHLAQRLYCESPAAALLFD